MTEISFYILPEGTTDSGMQFACRLAEKAYSRGHRLYVHTAEAGRPEAMDELLWTFSQGSFVPHGLATDIPADDQLTPVVIGGGEPPDGFDDILINLDGEVSTIFSRFQRHLEIVPPARRDAARTAYRFFRDRGYELETHHIKH